MSWALAQTLKHAQHTTKVRRCVPFSRRNTARFARCASLGRHCIRFGTLISSVDGRKRSLLLPVQYLKACTDPSPRTALPPSLPLPIQPTASPDQPHPHHLPYPNYNIYFLLNRTTSSCSHLVLHAISPSRSCAQLY